MEGTETPLTLVCLGTNGFYSTEKALTVSYIIPELGIIFDCGAGLYRASKYVKTSKVSIFMSHQHMDHLDGIRTLPFLSSAGVKSIDIFAEDSVFQAIEAMFQPPFYGATLYFHKNSLNSLNSPITLENGAKISYFPVCHTIPCLGFRVEYMGKIFVYITDSYSDSHSEYLNFAKNADLLLHEVYYSNIPEDQAKKRGHSCSSSIISFCQAANVKKLVITHHQPHGNKKEVFDSVKEVLLNAESADDESVYVF